jgi:hypothetical protein
MTLAQIPDLSRNPLDRLASAAGEALISRCRSDLAASDMFNQDGLLRPEAVSQAVGELKPVIDTKAFVHERLHNIHCKKERPGLDPGHPAPKQVKTVNHTICADQMPKDAVVLQVHEWPVMVELLAAGMEKPALYAMADPPARVNVMRYRAGETLNWHSGRSEFATTRLLQALDRGGAFEHRSAPRSDDVRAMTASGSFSKAAIRG